MEVLSKLRFVRLSPFKARDLARRIQGLSAADAVRVVDFSDRKAARCLGKTLKAAVANAQNNAKLAVDTLIVKKAVVDEGPRLKRFWARSRGSARPIQRRTSHVMVVLSDEADRKRQRKES